ncbi:hypothetical protein O181_002425 [Austropuccinia psidii MF-1]|uniref:Uncharacterized protein n=1 Tax=Austropuccinia psidii MF-1 TaxID=1389203 RepID=A0A9Q3BCF4_9BASI|nr:hypothetical protein [Austropuccinia psidii MF-1]
MLLIRRVQILLTPFAANVPKQLHLDINRLEECLLLSQLPSKTWKISTRCRRCHKYFRPYFLATAQVYKLLQCLDFGTVKPYFHKLGHPLRLGFQGPLESAQCQKNKLSGCRTLLIAPAEVKRDENELVLVLSMGPSNGDFSTSTPLSLEKAPTHHKN